MSSSYQASFSHTVDNKRVEYMVVELSEEYLEATAQLINTEWPRSLGQRVQGLRYLVKTANSTAKQLPVSLIIVDVASRMVVGHASMVSIATVDPETQSTVNLPFLQSIIIDKSLRGRGMGKMLMLFCEKYFIEYANESRGAVSVSIDRFDHLYLNTKDQQRFYETLGYVQIEPMLFFTNKNNSRCGQMAKMLFKSMSSQNESRQTVSNSQSVAPPGPIGLLSPPPPPPIPLPPSQQPPSSSLTWYKKRIDSATQSLQIKSNS